MSSAENAIPIVGRAPDGPLSSPRHNLRRRERIVAGSLHAGKDHRRERNRQECRDDRGRRGAHELARSCKVSASEEPLLGHCGA
jgi:hypothetical protein